MREFVKASMSYWLSQSFLGVQQMLNLFTPQGSRRNHPVTEAFNNVARATVDSMGGAMSAGFRASDNIQRSMVDLTAGLLTLGGSGRGGGGGRRWQGSGGGGQGRGSGGGQGQQDWAGAASDIGQQTADAFAQGVRAMGQTADVVGQAVGGGAGQSGRGGGRWGGGGGGQWGGGGGGAGGQQPTGWGPVPRPPQGDRS